jgi:acid phosphatase
MRRSLPRFGPSWAVPALVWLVVVVIVVMLLTGSWGWVTVEVTDTDGPTVLRHPTKVLVVVEENHSSAQMTSGMPYLFGLSQKYGYATDWSAIGHPSLPNYLAITGGSTFGVRHDRRPGVVAPLIGRSPSVFDQAIAAGKSARVYAESMATPCRAVHVARPRGAAYTPLVNPWTYFPASRSRCRAADGSARSFVRAASTDSLPNVGFLIPNLCNDAHNCPLRKADRYLSRTLPAVLHSRDFTSGRLVVVVTADEDDHSAGNTVLTSVLAQRLSGVVVTSHLTHYSLTRFIAEVLGVPPLRHGRFAPDMRTAFGL